MTSFTLRPYQQEMVDKAIEALTSDNPKPSILVASTGAGKSWIIAATCHRLTELDPEAGVLILQPSKEILEQNAEKLEMYGFDDIKVYSASVGKKEVGKYTMATIGSIKDKTELFKHVKYVLVDEMQECRIDADGMYQKFFDQLGITRIVGLTATPFKQRLRYVKQGSYLEQTATVCMANRFPPVKTKGRPQYMWGKILYKIEMKDLQDMGYLAPIKYYSEMPKANLRINSTGGDYRKEDIEEFGNQSWNRILTVILGVIKRDNPKRVLVFAPSVKASQSVCEALRRRNIKADHVDGKTPKKQRSEKIAKFKSGETQVMCNCQCLTAGFDLPALDTIVYALPTLSPSRWMQSVGRGVRIDPNNPDKTLTVFDLVGCALTMGRVENIRIAKENGFKDMLVGDKGRIDNVPLYKFRIPLRSRR